MHTNIRVALKPNFMGHLLLISIFFNTFKTFLIQVRTHTCFIYIWSTMLSSSLDVLLKQSKTTSPKMCIYEN